MYHFKISKGSAPGTRSATLVADVVFVPLVECIDIFSKLPSASEAALACLTAFLNRLHAQNIRVD